MGSWQKDQVLAFLLLLPSEKEIWQRAEKIFGSEVNKYWQQVQVNPWGMESGDLLEAVEKLTSNGQPGNQRDTHPASRLNCPHCVIHVSLVTRSLTAAPTGKLWQAMQPITPTRRCSP